MQTRFTFAQRAAVASLSERVSGLIPNVLCARRAAIAFSAPVTGRGNLRCGNLAKSNAILPMAKKFRIYRRRRAFYGARFLSYLAFFAVLVVVLFGSYRNQFGELFATYEPPSRKLPTVVYTGSNPTGAPAGPSVIKLDTNKPGANSTNAPAGPKVIVLDANSRSARERSKLPIVVKLGPNADTAATGSIQPNRIEVVDGDTVRLDGRSYRLVGVNTPEGGPQAKCAAERELAARASRRLREIVAGGDLRLDRVSCGCAAGTEGTSTCNYGRLCGVLTAAGRDVGLALIGEGLAKKYDCGTERCPPKQPWC